MLNSQKLLEAIEIKIILRVQFHILQNGAILCLVYARINKSSKVMRQGATQNAVMLTHEKIKV
jgi:hypothetical protein